MKRLLPLLAFALLSACTPVRERVILLPDAGGKSSTVVVKSATAQSEITQAYAAVELKGERLEPAQLDAAEVQRRYAGVLDAKAPPPRSHILYFESNKGGLTAESQVLLQTVKADLAANPAGDVVIIGHSDRVGKLEFNDRLSLDRAKKVRDLLVEVGIPERIISVVGRGEREPAVPTEDEVAEPRNRRVELKVR